MEDNSQIAGLRLRELSLKDLTFHTQNADLLRLIMKNEQLIKKKCINVT